MIQIKGLPPAPPVALPAMDTLKLIDDLQATLRRQMDRVRELEDLPLDKLRERPAPGRWSALEVVEHMNLSTGKYHQGLLKVYADPRSGLRFRPTFEPGLWGNFSADGMVPRSDGTIRWRMRTMGMFEPKPGRVTDRSPIERFLAIQQDLLDLLEKARTRGIEGARVTSTLGPILRFKAGDAFRFPIAHQERHLLQLQRTLDAVGAQRTASPAM